MLAAAILSAAAAAADSAGFRADSHSKQPARLPYQELTTPSSPSSLSFVLFPLLYKTRYNETKRHKIGSKFKSKAYIHTIRQVIPNGEQLSFFCFLRSTPHLHRTVTSICRLFASFHTILSCLLPPFVIRGLLHGVLSSSITLSVLCLLCSALLACLLTCSHEPDRPFSFFLFYFLFFSFHVCLLISFCSVLVSSWAPDHYYYHSRRTLPRFCSLLHTSDLKDWVGSDHLGVLLYTWVTFSIKFSFFFYHLSRSIICE